MRRFSVAGLAPFLLACHCMVLPFECSRAACGWPDMPSPEEERLAECPPCSGPERCNIALEPPACAPYPGAADEPCSYQPVFGNEVFRFDCAEGLTCNTVTHRCAEPSPAEAECGEQNDCQEGLVCNRSRWRCAAPADVGAECGDDPDCRAGLVCNSAQRRCAEPGEPGVACSSATDCRASLVCHSVHLRCAQRGEAGVECGSDVDCGPGLSCSPRAPLSDARVCAEPSSIDGPCSSDEHCEEPARCNPVRGRCRPHPGGLDEPCNRVDPLTFETFGYDCEPALRCDWGGSDTCRPTDESP